MKRILLSAAAMVFTFCLVAQPNFRIETYSAPGGMKANQYNNEAKKQAKSGQFNAAVAYACKGLRLADKKGQISNAQAILNDCYSRAIQENLSTIETIKSRSATFSGDETVTDRARIVNIYAMMVAYNDILSSLPESSFKAAKKKDPPLRLDIQDYRTELEAARASFEQGKTEAAEMHYMKGRDLGRSDELNSNKQAARHYRWSMVYSPGYKDSQTRYDKSKALGTTRMGIMNFQNAMAAEQYGDLGSMASDQLLSGLIQGSGWEFFEVITRDQLDQVLAEQQLNLSGLMDEASTAEIGALKGVNVLLVGRITMASADRQTFDPTSKQVSERVKTGTETYTASDGTTKKRDVYGDVYGYISVHKKTARAQVTGSYKILDVATGAVLRAGTLYGKKSWEYEWARFISGDRRAMDYSEKQLVNKGEQAYPIPSVLVQGANQHLSELLASEVSAYANEVGR